MVPQLTLLAAGLYPWPVLATLVETAVAAAQQTLLSKVRLGSIPCPQHSTAQRGMPQSLWSELRRVLCCLVL